MFQQAELVNMHSQTVEFGSESQPKGIKNPKDNVILKTIVNLMDSFSMNQLIDVVRTGLLSDIAIKQTDKEIESKIGKPSDIINLSDELDLWAYNYGLELYFERNILRKISIKYDFCSNCFSLPSYFNVFDDIGLNGLSSIDDLIKYFEKNDINWIIDKAFSDDTTICLSCNDISRVYYSLEYHHIISIQCISFEP